MTVDHPATTLMRIPTGGFVLEPDQGDVIRAESAAGGWRIDGSRIPPGWQLRREAAAGGGFVLRVPGLTDEQAARTSCMPAGGARERESRYLLMGDGRLFRMVLRGPRDGRFELLNWEAPGPYLTGRPQPRGRWRIEPSPACGGLADIRELVILFAAEILETDEPLTTGAEA
jgi:hypothetical protein